MRTVNNQELKEIFGIFDTKFNTEIYNSKPIFITSDKFWDGGINALFQLKEKAEFYSLANKMGDVLKELLLHFNEKIYIADFLCENFNMYFKWRDRKNYEVFREIYEIFKKGKCYELTVTEDADLIDLIIESNFRYFSNLSLFLPSVNLMIQPTCHTEIIVYSLVETEKVFNILKRISLKYPELEIKR